MQPRHFRFLMMLSTQRRSLTVSGDQLTACHALLHAPHVCMCIRYRQAQRSLPRTPCCPAIRMHPCAHTFIVAAPRLLTSLACTNRGLTQVCLHPAPYHIRYTTDVAANKSGPPSRPYISVAEATHNTQHCTAVQVPMHALGIFSMHNIIAAHRSHTCLEADLPPPIHKGSRQRIGRLGHIPLGALR